MSTINAEGWSIIVLNWHGSYLLKFEVQDPRIPNKMVAKEIDVVKFGEWVHYTISYQYRDQTDAKSQVKSFANGKETYFEADFLEGNFTAHEVSQLGLGRWFLDADQFPLGNVILDELVLFDGSADAALAEHIYQQYK